MPFSYLPLPFAVIASGLFVAPRQSRNSNAIPMSFCVEQSGSAESLNAVFLFAVPVVSLQTQTPIIPNPQKSKHNPQFIGALAPTSTPPQTKSPK
jgi:hypothetical protein